MGQREVDNERLLRFGLWGELQAGDGPTAIVPGRLGDLGLYKGQRGIWVDKERTQELVANGFGVTVAIAHTGTVYDDDLSDDGIIYRYPSTGMPGRDRNEIEATKNAKRFGIPVFVITRSRVAQMRRVRLGWVADWDDRSGQFLVMFGEEPLMQPTLSSPDGAFSVFQEREKRTSSTSQRLGQARFHFEVMLRYGPSCAMCTIDVREVLDTPHIVPVAKRGTNDPRNGLVMCATHHRAFDAHLFGIEPESLRVRCRRDGPDVQRMGIVRTDLAGLGCTPHPDAVEWRWDYWNTICRGAASR